jgi:hypothetical protein
MNSDVEIVGEITGIEVIAVGNSIREISRLRKVYGQAAGESSKDEPLCVCRTTY